MAAPRKHRTRQYPRENYTECVRAGPLRLNIAVIRSKYTESVDRLVNAGVIRPESKGWLISALDPFHDHTFEIEGLPDQYGGSTCVQLIKKQVQITAPTIMGPSGTWECMVWTAPTLDSRTAHLWTTNPQVSRQYPTNATGGLGTVNISKSVTEPGTTLMPGGGVVPWSQPFGWSTVCFSPTDDGNTFSLMRLVGGGFEVHNTTAELYKGGSVSVFSQPQASQQLANCAIYHDFVTSPTGVTQGAINKGRLPPASVADVISNTTAKSWNADYGAYVPFRLQTQEAGYGIVTSRPLILGYAEDSSSNAIHYNAYGTEWDHNVPATGFGRSDLPVRHQPMHTVGAFFSGLLPQATLTLDIRFFVEIAPTPSNQTLLSLARPSPPFDPVALEIYTRALGYLLPGCMVNENADGDWWKSVSGALKNLAPAASAFGPYGQIASLMMDAGSRIGDSIHTVRQTNKAKKKQKKDAQTSAQPKARPTVAPPSNSPNYNGKPSARQQQQ